MEGRAKDFEINEQGELVLTDAQWCSQNGLRGAAMVTEDAFGEITVEVFGLPTPVLHAALTALLTKIQTTLCN